MNHHPNIILCVCDQLRAFEIGCYGNEVIRTPNIDSLAREGVRFETACSNNPICTPARSTLLSGQYSRTCNGMLGCVGDPYPTRSHLQDTTLPEALKDAGYATSHVGKWHIQPQPQLIGFDEYVYPRVRHRHRHRLYTDNRNDSILVEDWTWDFEMERARDFLARRQGQEQPFFLNFQIEPPHMPLADAAEHYTRMYSRDQVPLRPNVFQNDEMARDEHWFKIYLWDHLYMIEHQPHTEQLPDGFDLRDLTALYYGLTTLVDDQVGRLRAMLENFGLADNTLLIFTSDHGDNLGSHGQWNKIRLQEESIRVPLIYHWPQQLQPQVVSRQVTSLVDIMPTALGLSGVPITDSVQGDDLSSVVRGECETVGANAAFLEVPDENALGIRTADHLFAVRAQELEYYRHDPANDVIVDENYAFFDLRDDPYQMNNLAGTPAQHAVADNLCERVKEWHQSTPWQNSP